MFLNIFFVHLSTDASGGAAELTGFPCPLVWPLRA
jgi:hypothetical protein